MTHENPLKWAMEEFDRESETQQLAQRRRRIVQDIRWCHEQAKNNKVLRQMQTFMQRLDRVQNYHVVMATDIELLQE